MRNNNRIIKIVGKSFPVIKFISNNGEYRSINLKELFQKIDLREGEFGYDVISDKNLFNSVELIDNALAWKKIIKTFSFPGKKLINTFFHLDPITTIENSKLDDNNQLLKYGQTIKNFRKYYLHISQEELGKKIGSDKYYISKIENQRTDLELKTLRKIYEVGFNTNMFIAHYDKSDLLTSFSNSILNYKFINWADKHKSDLKLIEGIDKDLIKILREHNIKSNEDLSQIEFSKLITLFSELKITKKYNYFESWSTQAKFITNSDWITVIKLQRSLRDSKNSKIEKLAKAELKEEIYLVE